MPCLAGSKRELEVYNRLPVDIVQGKGCRVWDDKGREFVDFYGGHAVAALGYGHPALTDAIQRQSADLIFQTNAVGLPIRDAAIAVLLGGAPEGLDRCFLVNSGAEANENALRLALTRTGRSHVVCFKGGFHGRTAAAGAVTDGHEAWYGFPNTPFPTSTVPVNDRSAFLQAIGSDTAAVIIEPVQGVAGAIDVTPEFLHYVREVCTEAGAMLIVDEVQTGVGRTGTLFAVEQFGVTPDLLTSAKGLGGGFPVAAVLCSKEFDEFVAPGSLGTTFGGGPIACAAMEVVLKTVNEPAFLKSVRDRASELREACQTPGVAKISGIGLMIGLHLGQPATPVRQRLLDLGFLTGDSKKQDVIRLLPPLIVSRDEVKAFGTALAKVLK